MINVEQEATKKQELIREGKRKINYDEKTQLIVKFFRTFTMDDRDLLEPYYVPNYYRVVAWTDDTKQYETKVVKSFKNYCFMVNQKLVIPLESPAEYLYVDLIKGLTWRDPGTSNGSVVMGRARIRLPPPTSSGVISSIVDLVGLNNDPCVVKKGALEYSMKFHTYVDL